MVGGKELYEEQVFREAWPLRKETRKSVDLTTEDDLRDSTLDRSINRETPFQVLDWQKPGWLVEPAPYPAQCGSL
jgi:hypothetical protein